MDDFFFKGKKKSVSFDDQTVTFYFPVVSVEDDDEIDWVRAAADRLRFRDRIKNVEKILEKSLFFKNSRL